MPPSKTPEINLKVGIAVVPAEAGNPVGAGTLPPVVVVTALVVVLEEVVDVLIVVAPELVLVVVLDEVVVLLVVVTVPPDPGRHWEYHWFEKTQVKPDVQVVSPVQGSLKFHVSVHYGLMSILIYPPHFP